jgi:hypothetical protein
LRFQTANEGKWLKINRSHPKINLSKILDVIEDLSKTYNGYLKIEDMLFERTQNEQESNAFLPFSNYL